jgi:NTP pyrophosphatase (non-canonical NTP hydrolase)
MSGIRRTHGSGNQARCFRDDHDPWREIMRAREKAHAKHGANSIEALPADDPRWLPILVEEIGEMAHCLTYDGPKDELRAEVIDVLAVASALLAAIDAS